MLLIVWLITVHLLDPPITEASYLALSPWMHSGFNHLLQNLVVFLVAGLWTERRVGSTPYCGFVFFSAYFSLYIPVAFEYGGLSNGASGLTKALVAYIGLVQLEGFVKRVETMAVDRWGIVKVVLHLGVLLIVASYIFVTVARFFYYVPRPEGMAVGAHFTGLAIGWLWYGYRLSGVRILLMLGNFGIKLRSN